MSLKTKASRRKLRRWGYKAAIKQGERELLFSTQAVFYGDQKTARETAEEVRKTLARAQQVEPGTIRMILEEHETVSRETVMQITGLQNANDIAMLTVELIAEDYCTGISPEAIDPHKLKLAYWQRAIARIKGEKAPEAEQPQVVLTDAATTNEPKRELVVAG